MAVRRSILTSVTFVVCAILVGFYAVDHAAAAPIVINFDSRSHGQIIDDFYVDSKGVTFTARNFQTGPDLAIVFDTTRTGTNDQDLEDAFDMGNIARTVFVKNVMILSENSALNSAGRIARPDDQGSEPANGSSGEISIAFDTQIRSFRLDLVDVEPNTDVADDVRLGNLSFRTAGIEVARVQFTEFVDSSSKFYDSEIEFGDNSANRIPTITAEQLGIVSFDEVVVGMGLCYAFDNIVFEQGIAVPEPSSAMLVGLPVLLLTMRQRNRTRK